jgi:hypothetical protein
VVYEDESYYATGEPLSEFRRLIRRGKAAQAR